MGKMRQLYLTLVTLHLFFYMTPINAGLGDLLTVPCVEHEFCWLYCSLVQDGFLGSGCCFERKFKNENGDFILLKSLAKCCFCCTAPSLVGLVPGAIESFCNTIPTTNNATSLVEGLCLAQSLKINCQMVTINPNIKLVSLDGCSGGGGGVLGPLGQLIG